jgi:predicted O-linked N-acetylglucosamine transferase (SPINDLY family)
VKTNRDASGTGADWPVEIDGGAVETPSDAVKKLRDRGGLDAAESFARRALAAEPDDARLHYALGNVLMKQDKTDEAVAQYIRAIALKPDYAEAYHGLGNALTYRGHFGTAIAACRKAVALKPDFPRALAALVHFKAHACDWGETQAGNEQLLAAMRRYPGEIPPFSLLSIPSTPAEQLICARQRARKLVDSSDRRFSHGRPKAARKIRIGYLSADFRVHAMAQLIVELIERHDRSAFEVTGYSIGPDDGSDMRKRLEIAFDHFVDLRSYDDGAAAERIHGDNIDILIDITGYTRYGRTRILAFHPAPVQVNLPGFPGTLGAEFIDYIIADPFVVPSDHQQFYAEKLVHLPYSYQPNDTKREISERTPSREECGLPPKGFVFCCFNNTYKITAAMFDVWMRLLLAVPGSILWLFEANALATENLRSHAAACGVDPARVIFGPKLDLATHLARYRLADLFLDTLPYNAHTTGSDALWLGLPILTCTGATYAGRVGGSLLRAAGLPELITSSLDSYAGLALQLACAPDRLVNLRRRLSSNRSSLPLFDMRRYTRDLETAFSEMWEIWCRGEAPRPIAVAAQRQA